MQHQIYAMMSVRRVATDMCVRIRTIGVDVVRRHCYDTTLHNYDHMRYQLIACSITLTAVLHVSTLETCGTTLSHVSRARCDLHSMLICVIHECAPTLVSAPP